jgi:Ca-activated chloride channel family protein
MIKEKNKLKNKNNDIKVEIIPSSEYALKDGETHLYVQFKLEAIEKIITSTERVALNLGVVLDRSGSMGGNKIDKAKKAVEFIIENMSKTDVFSLVIYDDIIETLIPASQLTDKTTIMNKVKRITARNMTDLHGGMMEGVKQVTNNKKLEFRNVCLLLSDGLANVGVTSKIKVAQAAKGAHENEGVTISTFGIGDDFDEDMLVGIADAASGEFYYIKTADDIPAFIEQEFQGLLETIASNIQVKLNLAEGVRLQRILGMPLDEQQSKTLKLGDLRTGNDRMIILDLLVPANKSDSKEDIVNFELSWIPTHSDLPQILQTHSCPVSYTSNEELIASENQQVLDNVAILETALIREKAIQLADQGRFKDAQDIMGTQQTVLRGRMSLEGASEKLESIVAENEDLLSQALTEREYTKASRKLASSMTYNLRKQRKK